MAAENSEPRSGIILQIALLAVVTLVVARFSLVSFFNTQMDGEYQRKVAFNTRDEIKKLHASETQALADAPIPIDKAMAMMASKPRDGLGATILPQASSDLGPLQGWSLLPRPESELTTAPAVATSPDGGAAMTGDAGAVALATADSGAPHAVATDAGHASPVAPKPQPSAAPKDKP